MTVLDPCLHCHRKADCPIKRDTLARLRGLNITKARIRCRIPQEDFPAGSAVMVEAFELTEASFGDDDWRKCKTYRRGIVSRWHRGEATIVLDKDQEIQSPHTGANPIGYLKVKSNRLSKVDAPIVELCSCGLSQERCANAVYPSIRDGDWQCWTDLREREINDMRSYF